MSRYRSACLAYAVLLVGAHSLFAAQLQWSQLEGVHAFDDANSWTPSVVPVAGDNVTFALDGNVDVLLGSPSVANDLLFSAGTVDFQGDDAALANAGTTTVDDPLAVTLAEAARVSLHGGNWSSAGITRIGEGGGGNLYVTGGGGFSTPQLVVGQDAGSEGDVHVSGVESRILVDGSASVASRGRGALTISDGALFQVEQLEITREGPGDGAVLVTGSSEGTPSTLEILSRLHLGDPDESGGTSTLEINSGGRVSVNAQNGFFVAGSSGGTATINVAGTGSTLESSETIQLGRRGHGAIHLGSGATISSESVTLGGSSSGMGVGNIDGAESRWTVSDNLVVGEYGSGSLNVTSGGLLETGGADIGLQNNSLGHVSVDGAGSLWNAAAYGNKLVQVGVAGDGSLDVSAGGQVDSHQLFIGNSSDPADVATVTIDGSGSIVNVATTTYVGTSSPGTLIVSNGGTLNTGTDGASVFSIDQDFGSVGGSIVNIDGAGSVLNHLGASGIAVGRSTSASAATPARLSVTGGGQVNAERLDISLFGNSQGLVAVGGANSEINVADEIQVATQGMGTLIVEDGGTVAAGNKVFISAFRTNGVATVTGAGSLLSAGTTLSVADRFPAGFNGSSSGTMNIFDGGTVTNAGDGLLARQGVNQAVVNVGDGKRVATWNNGNSLVVGGSGSATLNVNPGGVVNVANTLSVSSTSTVNLDGGEINVDALDISDPADFHFNSGTLRLTGDETLDSAALAEIFAGALSPTLDANQHLAVTGTTTIAAPIALNHASAALSVGATTDLSNVAWNAGRLNFTDQDLAIGFGGVLGDLVTVDEQLALGVPNNQLEVNTLANLNIPGGTLSVASAVNDGRIFISGSTSIDFDADDQGMGLINNEDLVIVNSSVAGDILSQGDLDVAGLVALEDGVALTSGSTVNFLIGGAAHGEFGALTVGGDVDLAGALDLSFTGGFAPSEGDRFEIIDVGGALSGTFDGLPAGALVGNFGGVNLFIDYQAGDGNDVALSTGLNVDVNDDGHVNGVDFLSLQRVTPSQIPQWQQQFGATAAIVAATSSVPEPTTMLLLVVGMGALLRARPTRPGSGR